jgi:hypothetical protein
MLIEIGRVDPAGRITCDHESTRFARQDFQDSARQQVHGLRKILNAIKYQPCRKAVLFHPHR